MSALTDLATIAPGLAADRPLPRFACPVSRRIGVLQYTRNELRRREREVARRLSDLRDALAACEHELAVLEAER